MKYIFIIVFFIITHHAYAQETLLLQGQVSFLSGENIYLKFTNTDPIKINDTLYSLDKISNQQIPVLRIKAKSTSSVVAQRIIQYTIKVGDIFLYQYFAIKEEVIANPIEITPAQIITIVDPAKLDTPNAGIKSAALQTEMNGRFTLSHMSNTSSGSGDRGSRQMGTIFFTTNHTGTKGLSTETYLNYTTNSLTANGESSVQNSQFRVYNFALKYNWGKQNELVIGRRFNYKLSSLGAIDGFQYEKKLGNFYLGGIAGYRPDLFDFSFNSQMFQYGAYWGHSASSKNYNTSTSIGYIEQTLEGKTDRRYTALQHTTNINKFNFFVSTELELYNPITNQLRLSSLYSSISYRWRPGVSFLVSYDTRKTIIYYESYLNEVSRYLLEDLNRDGLRLRANFKITSSIYAGISLTSRSQSDGQNASQNYNAYLHLTKMPLIIGGVYISANTNHSSTLKTQILMARYNVDFFKNKLQSNIYYRFQTFNYINWDQIQKSNSYYGLNANYIFNKKTSFNIFAEMSHLTSGLTNRLGLSLIKRF